MLARIFPYTRSHVSRRESADAPYDAPAHCTCGLAHKPDLFDREAGEGRWRAYDGVTGRKGFVAGSTEVEGWWIDGWAAYPRDPRLVAPILLGGYT